MAQQRLTTIEQVLDRYKQAIGGVEAIQKVQSETQHGEAEASGMAGKATFVTQTITIKSVTYEPLEDSMFELPAAVKALLK